MGVAPDQPSGEPPGIGIEQQLMRIEAMALLGCVGAVDAIAVELSGRDVVEVAVPDVLGPLRHFDALELAAALAVEQAQLNLLGIGREQREVSPASVPAGAEARMRSGGKTHLSAFGNQEDGGERRDGESELGGSAVAGLDLADVADIAAAVMRGVGVEDLAPLAAEGYADAIALIDVRREVDRDHAARAFVESLAQPREQVVVGILGNQPFEAGSLAIELMQGR